MAGYFPDVPANRFAYHLDGTKIYLIDSNSVLTDITSSAAALNDEDADEVYVRYQTAMIVIFPEIRVLSGYYMAGYWGGSPLQMSSDTTNGIDGTWTTIASPWAMDDTDVLPEYRQRIQTLSAGSVKALKFFWGDTRSLRALHLYGSIPDTSNADRLIFWDPISDNPTAGAHFDWGDVQQGLSYTKTFRIKNNSSTLTANDILISSGTETFGMAVQFSLDGTTYTPTINLSTLAPGAISGVLYVQRAVPANEPLRAQACRFRAAASSWS